MPTPSPKQLTDATDISSSYASMILGEKRTPPRNLAIAIYRGTGWRHASIETLTDQQMKVLEQVEPWVSPKDRTAARSERAA